MYNFDRPSGLLPVFSSYYMVDYRGRVACKLNRTQGCRNSNKKIYSKYELSFHLVKLTR